MSVVESIKFDSVYRKLMTLDQIYWSVLRYSVYYYAPTIGKRALSVAFVRPSIHPSVCLSVRRVHI